MWRDFLYQNIESIEMKRNEMPYKQIILMGNFIGELENGGIIQFFDNFDDVSFESMKEVSNEINCNELSSFLIEVENVFPGSKVPENKDKLLEVIDTIIDNSDDDEFQKLSSSYSEIAPIVDKKMDCFLGRFKLHT